MISPFICYAIVIIGSFWYFGSCARKWKKEHDEKLDEIQMSINDISKTCRKALMKIRGDIGDLIGTCRR